MEAECRDCLRPAASTKESFARQRYGPNPRRSREILKHTAVKARRFDAFWSAGYTEREDQHILPFETSLKSDEIIQASRKQQRN